MAVVLTLVNVYFNITRKHGGIVTIFMANVFCGSVIAMKIEALENFPLYCKLHILCYGV